MEMETVIKKKSFSKKEELARIKSNGQGRLVRKILPKAPDYKSKRA